MKSYHSDFSVAITFYRLASHLIRTLIDTTFSLQYYSAIHYVSPNKKKNTENENTYSARAIGASLGGGGAAEFLTHGEIILGFNLCLLGLVNFSGGGMAIGYGGAGILERKSAFLVDMELLRWKDPCRTYLGCNSWYC